MTPRDPPIDAGLPQGRLDRDQAVDAVGLQDGGKFGAAGRHLADRAVEIDVGDQPALAVAAHHIIDLDRLAMALTIWLRTMTPAGLGCSSITSSFCPA